MELIKKYIDFKFQKTDLIPLLALIFSTIAVIVFNVKEIYENSILENLQLVPLALGVFFCFKAKNFKPLYIIIALLLILFFLREISYGRVIYGAIPNHPHEFYPLSHFKYGYLTNIIIGLYLALIFIFGLIKKIWTDIFYIAKNIKFPIWTFLFALVFIILEIFAEKLDNTVVEEISELVIYCYALSICLFYISKTDNISKDS